MRSPFFLFFFSLWDWGLPYKIMAGGPGNRSQGKRPCERSWSSRRFPSPLQSIASIKASITLTGKLAVQILGLLCPVHFPLWGTTVFFYKVGVGVGCEQLIWRVLWQNHMNKVRGKNNHSFQIIYIKLRVQPEVVEKQLVGMRDGVPRKDAKEVHVYCFH